MTQLAIAWTKLFSLECIKSLTTQRNCGTGSCVCSCVHRPVNGQVETYISCRRFFFLCDIVGAIRLFRMSCDGHLADKEQEEMYLKCRACVFRPVSSSMCFSHTFTAIFPESFCLQVINNFKLVEMNGSFEYGTCSSIAPYRVPSQDLSKCLIQNKLIYFGTQKMDIWQVNKFIMINHTPVRLRPVP